MGVTAGSGSLVVTVGEIFPWLSVQAEGGFAIGARWVLQRGTQVSLSPVSR
jgi:hypothetical protein